jgi:membrane protease YdiL (CAAX protease family)
VLNAADQPPEVPADAELARPSARGRRRWWIHLLLLASYPLVLAALSGNASEKKAPSLGTGATALLAICGLELGLFAVVFGMAWLASRASRDELLLRWHGGFRVVLLGLGYSVLIRLVLAIVLGVIAAVVLGSGAMTADSLQQFFKTNRPQVEAVVDVNALRHDPVYFWLSLTLVSFVVGGLREELWRTGVMAGMRALWPQRFGSLAGQTLAVGLAAIIFGLGHLVQGTLAVGLTGMLGFALGMIIVLHRSIWPAVIAHGFFDAISLALLPLIAERMEL